MADTARSPEASARSTLARFLPRVVALSLVVFVVARLVDAGGTGPLLDAAAPYWLAKSLADVTVVSAVAVRSRWRGGRLVGSLAGVYAGLQSLALFESGLYGLLPWSTVVAASGTGILLGVVVAVLAAVAFGRLRGEGRPRRGGRVPASLREWAWKLPVAVVCFLALFLVAGVVVFFGVARLLDPAALATYEILEPPWWIFLFQALRGLAYLLLVLPIVVQVSGDRRERALLAGLLLGTLVSTGVVIPTGAIPGLLWVAHFAELFLSVGVYGAVVTALLDWRGRPLAWLGR